MAELVTTGGLKILFSPADVVALTDRDGRNQAVTCVYGVNNTPVEISEGVGSFLGRLDIGAEFAELTRPNGTPIWIKGSAVGSLRAPLSGEYDPRVQSVFDAGGLRQGVCEDVASARSLINARGGRL